MASTSSSAKAALNGALLRICQRGSSKDLTMPLTACQELDPELLVPQPGSVRQDLFCELALLFPAGEVPDCIEYQVRVNGEDFTFMRRSAECTVTTLFGGQTYAGFYIEQDKDDQRAIFSLVFGYARIEVTAIDGAGGENHPFRTKDILCTQPTPINSEDVESILQTLVADPSKDQALAWILSDGQEAADERYSLVEGGFQRGRDRSVETYLRLVEQGLDTVERALPVLRVHAASRMTRQQHLVDASQVRRFGAREAMWLAANPQVLRPAAAGGGAVAFGGRSLAPSQVASTRVIRDYDVYENQVVLAYLGELCSKLADFQEKLDQDQEFFLPARAQRSLASQEEESCSFLLVAMRMLMRRHRRYEERAEALRTRAMRLERTLRHIMPGVSSPSLSSLPLRKTKTFKEVYAYSQIYVQVERFLAFGETPYHADGLVLSMMRLDRVFEFYGLYRLLDGFRSMGFEPDRSLEAAGARSVFAGTYQDSGRFARKPSPIANVFHLAKGPIKAHVYYEPSLYADDREFYGCSLHRLSSSADPYTPDYVVILEHETERRVFILDAKYSRRSSLTREAEYNDYTARWDTCVRKYLRGVVDGCTGRIPDGLWLLAGIRDEEPPLICAKGVPWARGPRKKAESGLFLLSPDSDISVLFGAMGLNRRSLESGRLGDGALFARSVPELVDGGVPGGTERLTAQKTVLLAGRDAVTKAGIASQRTESRAGGTSSAPARVASSGPWAEATDSSSVAADVVATGVPGADTLQGAGRCKVTRIADLREHLNHSQSEEKTAVPAHEEGTEGAEAEEPKVSFYERAKLMPDAAEGAREEVEPTIEQIRSAEAKARRAEKKKEQQRAQQEEKKRKKEKEEKAQAKREARRAAREAEPNAPKKERPTKKREERTAAAKSSPDVEKLMRELISLLPKGDPSPLLKDKSYQMAVGVSVALLREDRVKDYLPMEHEGKTYYCYAPAKLPNYPKKLEKYVRRMRELSKKQS